MAQAPIPSLSPDKFRRGFGLDPIKSDMPLGSAASLVIHLGILATALFAWEATPPIVPEDVIAVDVVSDTPSVLGEDTAPETAQVGEESTTPDALPQSLPPPPAAAPAAELTPPPPSTQMLPEDTAQEIPQETPKALAPPAPVPKPAVTPAPPPRPTPAALPTPSSAPSSAPRPSPAPRPAPTPKPLLKPITAPATRPTPQPAAPQPAPKAAALPKTTPTPTAARQGQARPALPPEFDLSAASAAASGTNSGGPSAPQLTKSGKAGRLGKAGGGPELTGDLEAALRAQLKRCWEPPADMSNPRQLIVVVSIELGLDGRLLRPSVLVSPTSAIGANQRLVVAIDNAQRAVNRCAPFNLPPDRYDAWRQVRFRFDPELMTRR